MSARQPSADVVVQHLVRWHTVRDRRRAALTRRGAVSGAVGDLTDGPAHSGPPIATAKLQTLTNLFITVWMAVVPAMGSELRCVGTKRPILGPNRPKMWVKSLKT